MVAQACNPSTLGGRGGWITRSTDQDHPGHHGETLSLLKIQKIIWAWWCVPVIPATQEAEAGELPEPRRRRLPWAEIAPLHSSLGNKSETPSQKKTKRNRKKKTNLLDEESAIWGTVGRDPEAGENWISLWDRKKVSVPGGPRAKGKVAWEVTRDVGSGQLMLGHSKVFEFSWWKGKPLKNLEQESDNIWLVFGKVIPRPGVVAHTCNPKLWEAEAGGSCEVRSLRPAWPTWRNPVSTKNTKN